ncbi:3-ketoacyl-ACP reductase [Alkalihalobacillus alcalophilus ATCC 27647 = CGMCC 1.3604]|uniref:3-ketoacyl-ACP reductase n=1 Tax=Alkalihalobacillus alcalophilus ATCC 27647 = CGMCC 1.3604 TaxID=1218173 RepID=A0A094WNW3_ALKAL|nr:SDR family oxidoreductase [Alkalihalobacillus alcalophilus]KGA98536.1 3-ketoacyl-ACP reductase [Alkalihalobacillus alcalophilus ATCC 27647 = CGMCC 1.3604]MED1562687.1 SDR family oxidoreductase [Alkalihalobacillus alcalophilus]THG91684.1 3-ketoacyl-ACP reductase [Alkalihalobacillus alcalophilus ATCC 27647 = CGMCC 1.3604]
MSKKEQVLLTGASGGIGQAIAKSLATPRRTLFLHYYRNEKAIHLLKEQCEALGAEVVLVKANLCEHNGASELLRQITGQVDAVIHNAGIDSIQLFSDTSDDELTKIMNIHLHNPIKITRTLLPAMIRERSGQIVFISSIWGLTGASCEVIYSAAKGGVNSFVKALAKEVALSNIQVNAIAPGAIATEMLDRYEDEEKKALIEEIPAGRLGQPEEVAELVSFLLSKKTSYMNGQIISVNGAWYC